MRVGTVLRILGLILFVLGIVGGVMAGYGMQTVLSILPTGGTASTAADFNFVVAIIVWLSSAITACVIYALGGMSNNLDNINTRLEEMRQDHQNTQKMVRYIAQAYGGSARNTTPGRTAVQYEYHPQNPKDTAK